MKYPYVAIAALSIAIGAPAHAQTMADAYAELKRQPDARSDSIIVMTVPLKHLTSQEAVVLLSPYATTRPFENQVGGGVFPTPSAHAVTIREKTVNYRRMLKVLSEYDRPPVNIGFTFQLIVADKSGSRATEIASLDSLLRSALKYTGYKLLGVGMATIGENTDAAEIIPGGTQKFSLGLHVDDVRDTPTGASVKLKVSLSKIPPENYPSNMSNLQLLSTGLTVPIGQTVVLGTAALDNDRAIILTVRPVLASPDAKPREE